MAVGSKRKATVSPAKGSKKKAKGVPEPENVVVNKQTLIFLKNLKRHNDTEWMKEHKTQFEAAKVNFAELAEAVRDRMVSVDDFVAEACADASAQEFVEKINAKGPGAEDGPYNIFLAFHLVPKAQRRERAAYTLRLQPFGHTQLIAGLDKADGATLTALRTGLAEEEGAAALTEALDDETLEEEFGEPGMDLLEEHGDALTKAPKGFTKDSANIEFLKNRRFVVVKKFSDDEVLSESFLDEVVGAFTAAAPFVTELNTLISTHEAASDDEEEGGEEEHEGNSDESDEEDD